MGVCIIATGNPADGFVYYGTFKQPEFAVDFAERHLKNEEWWIITLRHPDELEKG